MEYSAADEGPMKLSFRKAQRAYPESREREASHRFLDSGSCPATRVLAGMTDCDTVSFAGMTETLKAAGNRTQSD
jgi:hypothetical protein